MDILQYIIIPTIIVSTMIFVSAQKRTESQKLKQQDMFAKRINDIKTSYRATLELFAMQRIIRPTHVNTLYSVINNYFVDQPITEQSTRDMENLAKRIAVTIAREMNTIKSDADTQWLQKKLLNFAVRIPTRGKDFNHRFYHTKLKTLIRGIGTTKSSFIQRHAA